MTSSISAIMGNHSYYSVYNGKTRVESPPRRCSSSPVRSSAYAEVAYYTVHPPSTPIHLLPIPTARGTKCRILQQQSKVEQITKKKAKKIVRHVLRLVLKSVNRIIMTDIPTKDVSVGSLSHAFSRSIAIQIGKNSLVSRHVDDEDTHSSSVDSCTRHEADLLKDIRSLRDSHVRLVLRQLRQLQDIERLSRGFCHTHSTQTLTSPCHIDQCLTTGIVDTIIAIDDE